jgi:GxxExxY protein
MHETVHAERHSGCTIAGVTPTEELAHAIVRAARAVHSELGPGFVESVYGRALVTELKNQEIQVEREKVIKIWYGSNLVGKHRLDLVVGRAAIVELKASRGIINVHMVQMNSYLHATNYPVGLILNFGMPELEYELVISPKNNAQETSSRATT